LYFLKRIIYLTGLKVAQAIWKMSGGGGRKFPLSRGNWKSEIVRYTDFVQLHSVCEYISKIDKPIVVEIGAYHGAYSIILGQIIKKKDGKVIAVEPNPSSYNDRKDFVKSTSNCFL